MVYARHFSTQSTPQSESVPGRSMIKNNAGGYTFAIDDWSHLDRFLILGAEGGTYYVNESKLSKENAESVLWCISTDGLRVVARTVEISKSGRAPRNNAAIFVLAMCASESCGANVETRRAALNALPEVCRIFTHLAQFLTYTSGVLRGRGRGLRDAVAKWYNNRHINSLGYQVVKYRNREGWTHRDALRIAHPTPIDDNHNALYAWIAGKDVKKKTLPDIVRGYLKAQGATMPSEIIPLIDKYGLTREMIPNTLLNDPSVWEALLSKMPMTAMVRNLGKMSAVGLLKPFSSAVGLVTDRLNSDSIRKARIHPLSVLVAMKIYQQGHGMKGSLKWNPVAPIVDALDGAFYLAFGNVEPTGKNIMLALDVSGSMTWTNVAGMPITPREASAAMAMVTARVEKKNVITVFSAKSNGSGWESGISYLDISPRQRLDDVIRTIDGTPAGRTDCALPMLAAMGSGLNVDAFAIYTDNETWAGDTHPVQALNEYRRKSGINARVAVVGMTSTGFSIADPNDVGMIDVVGFDTATPQLISGFISGDI